MPSSNFNFRHVEVFWAVMTAGSATAGAALLNTSQPTISRELARFEKLTGLTLFTRVSSKLMPTQEALLLFDEVQRAYFSLDRIATTAESIRNFSGGQLSIACLPAFSVALLPRACKEFVNRYPDVSISIFPQEPPLLQESLSTQKYHMGLSEDDVVPNGTELFPLLQLDVVCVLPPGHPLCDKQTLTPEDFANQNFIYLAAADPYRQKVDKIFHERGISRRLVMETFSAAAACSMVALGIGVAIINPLTALSYISQGLQIRRFSCSIPFSVNLIRPLHRHRYSLADSFADILQRSCHDLSAELGALLKT